MTAPLQPVQPVAHLATRADEQPEALEHFPLWLTTRQAWAFIGCRSYKATFEWIRRHGIVRRSNGTLSRRDLERELNRPRRHRMSPNSLRNLRRSA